MTLYGVAGHPVLHSRSPQIFNNLFRSRGVGAVYTRLAARTGAEALALARRMGVAGLNVTSPFKEEMYRLASARDGCSSRLLAANTVVLGRSTAEVFNTDPDGVRHALAVRAIRTRGERVVVLGSGGAARAAAHALVESGARVVVTSRTGERAADAAAATGCDWSELKELPDLLNRASGLVSCLPAGIDLVEESWLRPGTWVLDANYHRPELVPKAASARLRRRRRPRLAGRSAARIVQGARGSPAGERRWSRAVGRSARGRDRATAGRTGRRPRRKTRCRHRRHDGIGKDDRRRAPGGAAGSAARGH